MLVEKKSLFVCCYNLERANQLPRRLFHSISKIIVFLNKKKDTAAHSDSTSVLRYLAHSETELLFDDKCNLHLQLYLLFQLTKKERYNLNQMLDITFETCSIKITKWHFSQKNRRYVYSKTVTITNQNQFKKLKTNCITEQFQLDFLKKTPVHFCYIMEIQKPHTTI